MEKTTKLNHYTDSLYYDLEQTARYCKVLGVQLFSRLDLGLGPDEFAALDTISTNPDICQRDLAKLILKDRANTGRVLDSLESKTLIERFDDRKNNRLVRKMRVTQQGNKMLAEVSDKLIPVHNKIEDVIPISEINNLRAALKTLRESLSKVVEMQI